MSCKQQVQLITEHTTICACATGPVQGAIAVIRVSGPDALGITDSIFSPHGRETVPGTRSLQNAAGYTIHYGDIVDNKDQIVDNVLVSIFRAPHSYTGEDSVEISCHASTYIVQEILRLLLDAGCSPAQPGEFTQRSFLNGKMDLSQAEAVADVIASRSAAEHRMAESQMRGAFSAQLKELHDKLLNITSLLELEIDFSDHEELEFADRGQLRTLALEIESVISRLAGSFRTGNAIKNGIPVAIIGKTNAGKSTLLNALLGEDKAIVSPIQGTTRDSIEDTIVIGGVTFRFIDTAGIRSTTNTIEALGIQRTFDKLNKAQVVLWMTDRADNSDFEDSSVAEHSSGKQVLYIHNKADMMASVPADYENHLFISAKDGKGIERLTAALLKVCNIAQLDQDNIIVSNIRHYQALTAALEAIRRVISGLETALPSDLISQDLRQCLFHLEDIMGSVTTPDVLSNIFSHFCIGK